MTGGDLKIEVLPAGSVVPAFGLLEAVSKGTLDGGHGVLGYHYGKQNALALWNSGPAFGMDANMILAWHKYGGGAELLAKLYASIGGNVVLSGKDGDYVHFIYFSLASLTTVGFGDIYAVNTFARMLATFLSTLGVLFPAIVIARLVGLASSRS